MSRKRPRLVPETLGLKRRRDRGPAEADPSRGVAGSARAAVAELVRLFPRGLFEDALPPIVLRSQVYSLVPDRTAADRQLVRGVGPPSEAALRLSVRQPSCCSHTGASLGQGLRCRCRETAQTLLEDPRAVGSRSWRWKSEKELQEQREIRVVQLGFDLDAHGIILTEDYRTIVLKACDGRSYAGAVQKFLASVLPACGDLSVQQDQMTQTFGFRDMEITQLVNAGVLTVRDAGSWWLAVPGAGRFIKHFVKELLGRRAPASVRLGLAYHVHDLIGAQLVDCVSTTSGTLLRLPET
ncbi:inactive serine/threonine-protein kinase 19 isoform 2-T2 [Molossus nigricans]